MIQKNEGNSEQSNSNFNIQNSNFTNPLIQQQLLTKEQLLEQDERYKYLSKFGEIILTENNDHRILVILPQIPNTPIFYRSNQSRESNPFQLDMSNKHLTQIPLIEGEEKVQILILSQNKIGTVENLVSLPSLEKIDLSENQILVMENFQNIPSIQTLILNSNLIEKIANVEFLPNLKVLHLKQNKLTNLQGIYLLKQLEELDVSGNQIEAIELKKNAQKLVSLNIQQNPLGSLEGFEFLPNLRFLDLSDTDLDEQELLVLQKLANLKELNINEDDMFLTTFVIDSLKSIKFLNGKLLTKKNKKQKKNQKFYQSEQKKKQKEEEIRQQTEDNFEKSKESENKIEENEQKDLQIKSEKKQEKIQLEEKKEENLEQLKEFDSEENLEIKNKNYEEENQENQQENQLRLKKQKLIPNYQKQDQQKQNLKESNESFEKIQHTNSEDEELNIKSTKVKQKMFMSDNEKEVDTKLNILESMNQSRTISDISKIESKQIDQKQNQSEKKEDKSESSISDQKNETEEISITEENEIKKYFLKSLKKIENKDNSKPKEKKLLGTELKKIGCIQKTTKSVRVLGDSFQEFFENFQLYQNTEELSLEYILIDNLILKENRLILEKMKKLRKLTFNYNNIIDYLELINFENIPNLTELVINNNSVIECDMLKYFIFYRYSKIEFFNEQEKTEEELEKTKDIYLDFDKILQKLHKINFKKFNLQNSDKQKISKKVAESFIQNLKNKRFIEKNFDVIFEGVVDEYLDSILQQIIGQIKKINFFLFKKINNLKQFQLLVFEQISRKYQTPNELTFRFLKDILNSYNKFGSQK